jgi:NAD(P)-dependent dehydrogenase (short-subunit alcohol dehydrogenase family)
MVPRRLGYDELFAINTRGPYFAVQRLVGLMSEGGGIVLTTSSAMPRACRCRASNVATKAALRSMTRTLARELVGRGVRVNAVSPARSTPASSIERCRLRLPSRPSAVCARTTPWAASGHRTTVAFLAFDATFTTGAELVVDGACRSSCRRARRVKDLSWIA